MIRLRIKAWGRKASSPISTELRTAFPDLKIAVDHMVADDDNVAFAYTVTGTHDGPLDGDSLRQAARGQRKRECRSRVLRTGCRSSAGAVPTSSASCSKSALVTPCSRPRPKPPASCRGLFCFRSCPASATPRHAESFPPRLSPGVSIKSSSAREHVDPAHRNTRA